MLLRDHSAPLSAEAKGAWAPQDLPPALGLRFPTQDSTEVSHRMGSRSVAAQIPLQRWDHPAVRATPFINTQQQDTCSTPSSALTCVRGCGQRHGVPLGSTSQGSPGARMGAQTEKKPKAKAAVCRCPSENIGFPALLGSAQTRQAVFAQQILFVIS